VQADATSQPTTGKPRRRRARAGEGARLRQEILDAADRLLRETGSEAAVSIDAIAGAVGCTPPAIYLHFADKRSLIREVCERYFAQFADVLNDAAAQATDPLESLAARGRAYVQFGLEHPEYYRILFMHRPDEGASQHDLARVRANAAFDDQERAVQRCIDAGHFPPGTAHNIACALWASTHGMTSLLISKPGFPWPPLNEFVELMLAHGLGFIIADRTHGAG